jgi:hypothetical protein
MKNIEREIKMLKIIAITLLVIGMLLITIGIVIEVREMLIDHYCTKLTPYEFNLEPKCQKYKEVYYATRNEK